MEKFLSRTFACTFLLLSVMGAAFFLWAAAHTLASWGATVCEQAHGCFNFTQENYHSVSDFSTPLLCQGFGENKVCIRCNDHSGTRAAWGDSCTKRLADKVCEQPNAKETYGAECKSAKP